MFTLAFLVTPFPEWFRYDLGFDTFLQSFDISVNNANELIAPAATQFLVVIMLVQTIAFFKSRKTKTALAAESADAEKEDSV